MITPVDVLRPAPVSVTACPGFADGSNALAGVPLDAKPMTPVSDATSGALVPPNVVTLIGPNAPALNGTVRLTVSFGRAELNTSGPLPGLGSVTATDPKLYWLLLASMKPRPRNCTLALLPSEATELTVMLVTIGTISSGNVPSAKSVRTPPGRP